jgi:hypothetical protein
VFSGMSLNNSAMSLFEHPGRFLTRAEGVAQRWDALIDDRAVPATT